MTDIIALAHEITLAFKRRDLSVPAAVILASHEDGMRLLAALQANEPAGATVTTLNQMFRESLHASVR